MLEPAALERQFRLRGSARHAYRKRKGNSQILFRHPFNTNRGVNNQRRIIGTLAEEAKHCHRYIGSAKPTKPRRIHARTGRLQVALVATKVQDVEHLGAGTNHFSLRQ